MFKQPTASDCLLFFISLLLLLLLFLLSLLLLLLLLFLFLLSLLLLLFLLSALLDQFVDRHEGLLESESLQSAAGLNLPRPVGVTGEIQLGGDLGGQRR